MKRTLTFLLLLVAIVSKGQDRSLKELINYVVGGTWTSINEDNDGEPEGYKSYYMNFSTWSDDESVTGTIYGVKNNGDTIQLIEVWNFIDKANQSIFYVHRTTWGSYATGTIQKYEGKHIDIQFKSTTPEGQQYFTRDLHYIEERNRMRAVTYHKSKEGEEWKEANRSEWTRTY
ncbi:hypothetical protein AAOE16_02385 [Ekhidna sp. MALMAid0563]|uniref:hypothetical protein n=1 Tax=Ekhidna sp. MALMAid0563 TaxID=3143937 RepID=UPI0032DF42A7